MKYKIWQIISLISLLIFSSFLYAKTLKIVAAENFYGEVAKEIGGSNIEVKSILSNPNQDPHLFSIDPSTARLISDADIVIYNGIGYDPWMEKLLASTKHHKVIVVAQLIGKKPGDNPHIWYDPLTMPLYSMALAKLLGQVDHERQAFYVQQYTLFNQKYQSLVLQIIELKHHFLNTPVLATEPVFNYMADALGLKMLGQDFQLSVMNDIPPSASQTQEFQNNLLSGAVRVLIYNNQVSNPVTERMQAIAKKKNIPIVGVSEMQPLGKTYVQWMQEQLNELDKDLKGK